MSGKIVAISKRAFLFALTASVGIAVGAGCPQNPPTENTNDNATTFGDGGDGSDSGPGKLIGQVVTVRGEPVPGVAVSLNSGQSASADDNGFYSFSDLTAGQTVVAQFRKAGFASTSKSFVIEGGEAAVGCVTMAAAGETVTLDASTSTTQAAGNSNVTLAGGSLVDGSGSPVSGSVELTTTFVDPSTPAVMAFPGSFDDATRTSGGETTLESFGFAIYEMTQNGLPVNLAPGAAAEIEYVLPDNAQANFKAGDSIPLWAFAEETAEWVEAGTGEIRAASDGSGRLAWFATVTHFSSWNCDAPIEDKTCIGGRVTSDGEPVSGALVTAVGLSYNGTTTDTTDSDGRFCVDVKRGARVRLEVRPNGSARPAASLEMQASDTSASCATGGCQDAGELTVSFTSCVSGIVLDENGNPAEGVTVYAVPGTKAKTGPDGRYCVRTVGGQEVFVFAEGRPSVKVKAPLAAACDVGCATADLTLTLPDDGDLVGYLSATHARSIFFSSFFNSNTPRFDLFGSFFIANFDDFKNFNFGDYSATTTTVADCDVTVSRSTHTYDPAAEPVSPPFAIGALDAGRPGVATTPGASVELHPGDPNQFDPPIPSVAGTYSPVPAGVDLLALGFNAGLPVTFDFPGGTDVGPFSASIDVPAELIVTAPNLLDPGLTIDTSADLAVQWQAGDANDIVRVSIFASQGETTENPDGSITTRNTSTSVHCEFPDNGSGVIPAAALGQLPVGTSLFLNIERQRTVDVNVPLPRVNGTGVVRVVGSSSVSRSFFEE